MSIKKQALHTALNSAWFLVPAWILIIDKDEMESDIVLVHDQLGASEQPKCFSDNPEYFPLYCLILFFVSIIKLDDTR